jgi:hypothetical protein
MNRRVLILVAVMLIVGAVILPNLRSCKSQQTQIITRIKATQVIERGTFITPNMVKEVPMEVKVVEGKQVEVEVEEKGISSSVAEASTKLGQVIGKFANKDIKEGDFIDPAKDTTYFPSDKETISFPADIDKDYVEPKRGDIIDIYAYYPVQEDEPTRMEKIAACILVVDSHSTSGEQAKEGVPASIVTVAVEPEIAWRLIEFLGSRGFRAWVTLSDGSCLMPTPTPTPTPIPPTPTPIPPTPTPVPPTPTPTPTPGPRPDLVGRIISDSLVEDQPGTVLVEVTNQGPAGMAKECLVGLYIGRPAKGEADKLMVCPALGVGESAVISYTVTLDEAGYHLLTAWADVLEEIPEEDETNNQDSASLVVESPTPTPMPTPTNTPTVTPSTSPTPETFHIHLLFDQWWVDKIGVVDLEGRPVDLELKKISEGIYYADYYGRGFEMTVKNNGRDMDIWRGDANVEADVFIDGVKAKALEKRPIKHGQERTIKVQLRDGFNEATVVLVDD